MLSKSEAKGAVPVDGAASPLVLARGLGRAFRSAVETVWAVRGVDLEVRAGQFICILGASGSGKSTLLHLIGGLDTATEGSVVVAGVNVTEAGEEGRARLRLSTVGMVFQDHNLIEEFSAVENVMLPLEALGTGSRQAREDAASVLASVGLAGLEQRFPHQLSGGQRQRVGIARALAGSRRLLLADEPTGELDSATSRGLYELLKESCKSGVSVLMATHDSLACEYADAVFRMVDGRLEPESAL